MAKITKLTTAPTEADLQARITGALRRVFNWLPPGDSLRHETKFEFRFGRSKVTIDGADVSKAQARSDILVYRKDAPLAVLELKREGVSLTKDDQDQGLSYARMLHPRPPLVVVTNGEETITLESYSGDPWKPETPSESELDRLISAAGKAATADLKHAVEVLLGPDSTVWVAAIRAATDAAIADLTGDWSDSDRPFVADFLIPRKATQEVIEELRRPRRVVIVDGAPLAGKSSVLRELALSAGESDDLAVLFIDADGGGSGLLESTASILADALGWHVTADETRAWLRTISRLSGPALVLAVDGIGAIRNEVRRDIEDLTDSSFGSGLRLVLGMDDAVTPSLVRTETRRNPSRIGRRASTFTVGTLDDHEFSTTVNLLHDRRILIIDGGQSAPEYRIPWVIRALVTHIVGSPNYKNAFLAAGLPPLLGPDLLRETRERFGHDYEIRHGFQALAEALLADLADTNRPMSTILESMVTFFVRRASTRRFIESTDIRDMVDRGFAKLSVNEADEPVVIPRLPELLASELALLLSAGLADKLSSAGAKASAEWFVTQCAALPLGDVIGAQAILDCSVKSGSLPMDLIQYMLNARPRVEKIRPGKRIAMYHPDAGLVDLTFRENGTIFARAKGWQTVISPDEAEEFGDEVFGQIESWLILAHVAGYPILVESRDGKLLGRVDPALLMEIGTCPFVLRRPVADQELNAVLTHEIEGHGSVVCHNAGIVEPITFSILKFLGHERERTRGWIDEAVNRNSLPLLSRIDIALRHLADGGDTPKAGWARNLLKDSIQPALSSYLPSH